MATVLTIGIGTGHDTAHSNMPTEMRDMIVWAVSLFEQADLELPEIEYVYHDGDRSQCRGRDGIHSSSDGRNIIGICATDTGFPTRVMILHETAHAWADHSLTETRRNAFKDLRGWDHWRNYQEAAWHENGTEQAAEIMVWGLIDTPIAMVRIYQNSCDDLQTGYETLTGSEPLHGFRDHCED